MRWATLDVVLRGLFDGLYAYHCRALRLGRGE
jgi:hypothetical protein